MKIFNLSWPFSGERHAMIIMNKLGYNVSSLKSQLGHEIIYSYNNGVECFFKPHVDYYSLLESEYKIAGSIYPGQAYYRYIDSVVDDAYYIFLERNIDDWIKDVISSGYAYRSSIHRQIPFSEAVKKIINEKKYHDQAVKEYFYKSKRFLATDIFNEGISPLIDKFGIAQRNEDKSTLKLVAQEISGQSTNVDSNNHSMTGGYSEKDPRNYYQNKYDYCLNTLVNFCVSGKIARNIDSTVKLGVFVDYNASDKSVSPSGKLKLTDTHGYISNPAIHWKYRRVASVLNEIIDYELDVNIAIDMQDARKYGISPASVPRKRLITYCRRKGADNLVLWPLPGYHTIGADNFLGGYLRDTISFKSKKDIAVWRGAFSGSCSDVIGGVYENPAHQVVNKIKKEFIEGASLDLYEDMLRKNIRFNFVFSHINNADVDAYLVPDARSSFLHDTIYADYMSSKLSISEIYGYRYIICLRGYDTASNFLLAASSNSVALKEEDGWEVFYSVLFKPWEHYIPLSPGGLDVDEKIEWARKNPDKVTRIINNANEICCYLSRNDLRKDMCRKIVQRINSLRD